MPGLVRLSITMEKPLYAKLEQLLQETQYGNRSEFVRDLVRARLVEEQWKGSEEALGTITLIYNHDQRNLSAKLTATQHHHHHLVLATTHVHLDHHNCAEMIMCKGSARDIEEMAAALGREKGVLHANLSISSTGRQLA
jgi:CopG family nickel-responsive transcriptional regulator